jgi:ADP-ribose diphosphatase
VTVETVYEGKRVTLLLDGGLELVRHAPVAATVAVDAEGRVVLVRQARPAAGTDVLEIPAGLVDRGESPFDAARRELREETGLRGGDWERLGTILTSPGFTDERVHLFLATDVTEGEAEPEADEELEVVRVPGSALPGLIPELEDAKTLAALLLYLRR